MTKPVSVVYERATPPVVVFRCATIAEAEAFLAGIQYADPTFCKAVEDGAYGIDAPEEMMNPPRR